MRIERSRLEWHLKFQRLNGRSWIIRRRLAELTWKTADRLAGHWRSQK